MNGKKALTRREDFARVYRSGSSWAGDLLVLRALPNDAGLSRYGLTAGKKTGGAVLRNRFRRRLREILRKVELKQGWDIVVIARPKGTTARFSELRDSLTSLLKRAELIEDEEFCLKND